MLICCGDGCDGMYNASEPSAPVYESLRGFGKLGDVSKTRAKARPTKFQLGLFYCAIYILALGYGCNTPSIMSFGAEPVRRCKFSSSIAPICGLNVRSGPSSQACFSYTLKMRVSGRSRSGSRPVPVQSQSLYFSLWSWLV